MKTLNYLFGLGVILTTLSSCSSIQQVADDDVYVTKNPKLTTSEEVNDVSSYENYRYRKSNHLFRTRYGRSSGINVYPSVIVAYNSGYSPFNDPFYYPHQYGTVYGSGMYFQYGNYDSYYYGYPYYGYYNGWYGNCYGGNYYGNGNYSNGNYKPNWSSTNTQTSYNTHYGPRNTLSGVNNYGTRGSGQKLGISKQTNPTFANSSNSTFSQNRSFSSKTVQSSRPIAQRSNSDQVKTSRTVSSGSGLSGTSTRVSTSTHREASSVNRNSSSTRPSSSSTHVGSSSSTRSNESSGSTFRSSGSSSGGHSSGGSSTPRGGGSGGSGSSTPTKRGGR